MSNYYSTSSSNNDRSSKTTINRLRPLQKHLEKRIESLEPILSPVQLKHLSEHKYTSSGISLLDSCFQVYWRWCAEQLPLNLAPNLITIVGLIINVVTSSILIFYSPAGLDEIPAWALILCAFGLFAYQTLDAIDGKQARRTNSSTPLGELFDHGCDAISTIFVGLALCLSLRLSIENPWLLYFVCTLGMGAFYVAHWQTYVTGSLKFGKFDCTEAQLSIYTIYILTAIFGDSFWTINVPILNIDLRYIPFILSTVGPTVSILTNLYIISKGGVGKNFSSVANTSIIFPYIPVSVVFLLQFMIARKSEDHIFEKYACLYILAFGFVWAKTTIRLIVAHMTRGQIYMTDSCLIGPLMLLFNQYFNFILPEYYVLWACLIYNVYDLTMYCCKVCLQICSHLNIYLFKIGVTPPPPATSSASTSANSSTISSTSSSGGSSGGGSTAAAGAQNDSRTSSTTTRPAYNTRSSLKQN